MRKKIIAVDLDGTLTKKGKFPDIMNLTPSELEEIYENVKPNKKMINLINKLSDKGHLIYIYTSRWDLFQEITARWLKKHKVKHEFFQMNKNFYDLYIGDKCINIKDDKKMRELWNGV